MSEDFTKDQFKDIKNQFGKGLPLLFILLGGWVFFSGCKDIYRAYKSASWPTSPGVIQQSSIKGGNEDALFADITYQYTIDGKNHSGQQVAFGDYGSSMSSHAHSIVGRYPEGMVVTVYYQANPEMSVLEPGVRTQAWFSPILGLTFLIVGIITALVMRRTFKMMDELNSGAKIDT